MRRDQRETCSARPSVGSPTVDATRAREMMSDREFTSRSSCQDLRRNLHCAELPRFTDEAMPAKRGRGGSPPSAASRNVQHRAREILVTCARATSSERGPATTATDARARGQVEGRSPRPSRGRDVPTDSSKARITQGQRRFNACTPPPTWCSQETMPAHQPTALAVRPKSAEGSADRLDCRRFNQVDPRKGDCTGLL